MGNASNIIWQKRWALGLGAAIAAGIFFRLVWLHDVEYKGDEAWTFSETKKYWETHTLRTIGMPSSAGLPNAGMSLWVFVAIGTILPIVDPLELTRSVQVLNIIAILLLTTFVQKSIPPAEREPWLFSVALVSINPLAVLFSRKLWPPDILPFFTLGMLVGWWYRGRRWGAFLWGLVGALLGQIQLAGFLFAAAFVGCTLLVNRRVVHWLAWFVGSIVGALPLMPWLLALSTSTRTMKPMQIQNPLSPVRHWLNLSLGLDLPYSLGNNFHSFLAYPNVGGNPTYLTTAVLGVIVIIALTLLARLVVRFFTEPMQTIWFFLSAESSTTMALNAAFFGYGLLLIAMLRPIYLHYFIVTFSLPALSLAWIAQAGSSRSRVASVANSRRLLAVLAVAQASVTFLFLAYVHQTQIIDGDYGVAYGSQFRPPMR